MTITISPSFPSVVPPIKEKSQVFRWIELSLVITGIATVIILSFASILPAYFLFTAEVSLITSLLIILLHTLLARQQISNEEGAEKAEDIGEKNPLIPCVVAPIVEEGIFRGIVQAGLQNLFSRFLPNTLVWSLTLPAILAIGVASALFGLAHLQNNYQWQPLTASLNGIGYGLLYYHFGLPAAIFKHVIHDTIVYTLKAYKEENPPHEMVKL
ncbi:MAG TPA: CPBP family intramembrane glutamic endopeptidase [Chlamydiales bacterium]|nr:CPBP family intramembrane glutamic endopeptidase [Chlamydiales bacterium]